MNKELAMRNNVISPGVRIHHTSSTHQREFTKSRAIKTQLHLYCIEPSLEFPGAGRSSHNRHSLLAWRRGSLKLRGKEFSFRIIQVDGYKCKPGLFKNWNIQNFAGRSSKRIMILFRLNNSFTRLDCDLKNYSGK